MGYLVHLCKSVYKDRHHFLPREEAHSPNTSIFGLLGLSCAELHGDIKQAERIEGLESFRRGAVSFLLASDLASRGLISKAWKRLSTTKYPRWEDYIHRSAGRLEQAAAVLPSPL